MLRMARPALGAAIATPLLFPARCAEEKKPWQLQSIDDALPIASVATFGGMSGYASGFAMKKMGKAALGALGGVFCMFQLAASYGYVRVDWPKVEKDVMAVLDVNRDGKVDADDMHAMFGSTVDVLTQNTDLS